MLEKILAPLDGSPLADAVLPHIIALTQINGATVTLLHVLETSHGASSQVDPVEWHLRKTEAETYLQETGQKLQKFDLETEQVVLEGRAADRIVAYAQKGNFDLVVLSSHGQGGLSGWNLSSVAHKVIHRIRKSTLIVPAHRTLEQNRAEGDLYVMRYKRILVPLDGSPRAESVLPLALALAAEQDAELILAHVVARPDMIQRMPLSEEDHNLLKQIVVRNGTEAERYFTQLRARLYPKLQTRVLESDNVERALLSLAEDESIDLVILTAHGHAGDNSRAYGRLAASFIDYGSAPLYIHQDLKIDEIKPLYAERMLHGIEPKHAHPINAHEYHEHLEYTIN